jgi:pyruvate-formate lyase-activating enzyme
VKARVIITLECNRKCDGCCNTPDMIYQAAKIPDISHVTDAEEIILTGGEPMLKPDLLLGVLDFLRNREDWTYTRKIYLYSALFHRGIEGLYEKVIPLVDGFQFTIHKEATYQEVAELKKLSQFLKHNRYTFQSLRLCIDTALFERFHFGNVDLSAWDSVRKMKWIKDCPLPKDEKLFILNS